VREEERAGHGIVDFTTVVALDALDGGAKLCTCVSKKVDKGGKSVRFEAKWENPNVVRAII
jgi:hypothetical protein